MTQRLAIAMVVLLGCGTGNSETPAGERDVVARPEPPPERTDLIGREGTPQTLIGTTPEVGDRAPAFELRGADMKPVRLADYRGKRLVLSVVPSIDTRVCEAQTHAMTEAETSLPDGTALLTVSRDLPMAQQRFIEEAQIKTTMASDFKGGGFGLGWGLAVKETGLLARSVWIIAADGRITYRDLVADQSTEPDYEALRAALAE